MNDQPSRREPSLPPGSPVTGGAGSHVTAHPARPNAAPANLAPAIALDPRGLPIGYPFKPEWEVTPRDAAASLLEDGASRPVLLDCRRDDEWAFNRIAGAVHVPMSEIERRADELEDERGGRAGPIIVQCHHGVRSLRVTAALRALGFTNVKSLAGGIDLWSLTVDSSVPRY